MGHSKFCDILQSKTEPIHSNNVYTSYNICFKLNITNKNVFCINI